MQWGASPPPYLSRGAREYNWVVHTIRYADKMKRRNKALAASKAACLGAVICWLCSGGVTPPSGDAAGAGLPLDARPNAGAGQNSISPQAPPCLAESAFSKSLPKGFHWPEAGDELSLRVLEEYGATFVAQGVATPPVVIFPDQNAVSHWQSNLSTEQAEFAGVPVRLQRAAMQALMKAREEAIQTHAGISPRASDAAQRSYDETLELWRSRVDPGLRHWIARGALSAAEAERIRKLPARQQASAILKLERRGLYFSKDFSKSILFSVAPPGASQHLSLLAFDVKEHDSPVVRSILERHGWFQTVRSDLPHFTYLGVDKNLLPRLGLKMVRSGGRVFWLPDLECPMSAHLAKDANVFSVCSVQGRPYPNAASGDRNQTKFSAPSVR